MQLGISSAEEKEMQENATAYSAREMDEQQQAAVQKKQFTSVRSVALLCAKSLAFYSTIRRHYKLWTLIC